MFSFTVSSNSLSIARGNSGSIVLTQVSADPQKVQYGVSSQYAGGWDRMPLDQFGNVTYATSVSPATITGSGSMTITFSVSSSAKVGQLVLQVYGLQQINGNPASAINQAHTVTITVT